MVVSSQKRRIRYLLDRSLFGTESQARFFGEEIILVITVILLFKNR
jgi:hypothetical protein